MTKSNLTVHYEKNSNRKIFFNFTVLTTDFCGNAEAFETYETATPQNHSDIDEALID